MKGREIKRVGKEIKRDGGIKGSSRGEKVFNLFRSIWGLLTGSGGLGSVRFRSGPWRHSGSSVKLCLSFRVQVWGLHVKREGGGQGRGRGDKGGMRRD